MRRLARYAAMLALIAPGASADEISSGRSTELRHLVLHDCGSCHGMTMKGGLGRALNPDDLAGIDASDLAEVILDGVPGTPMPPWRGLITEAEATWIARALKDGQIR